jgi:ectoine hydroxylase-related dioxygenase (phytanoyl-CoA dioxygenase family)
MTPLTDYKRFEYSNPLTREQLNFFDQYGFLHFKEFVSPQTVALFKEEMRSIEEQWVQQNVQKVNGVPIKYGMDIGGRKIVQRFAFSSQYSKVFAEFLRTAQFDALFPLLGSDAENPRVGENERDGLVINHYINTKDSTFTKMGWHTDCLRDIFYGKKIQPMLNVGIHLTDAAPDQSGLRILPGTHKQNIFGLLFKKRYFMDHRPDKNEIGLKVKAGDLTIHDGRLWHRVAQSTLMDEKSRRQVMYVPIISGEYAIKNEQSPTLLYQRFIKMRQ